ncbi:MAG: NAD(P)/FAD-dependent oxidoreductase [Ginsengibacter sp.]
MQNIDLYQNYDVAIVGGGLAGLSLSILCSRAGYKTILFEKEKYPFHKVCGEYISFESWNFINDLGLNLSSLNLPVIKNLIVSSPNGKFISSKLDTGGFGVSRYFLDNELKQVAENNGVIVLDNTKVDNVLYTEDNFLVHFNGSSISAKVTAGTFGKRSNLDVKWKRDFTRKKQGQLNNYLGIKYHIKTNFPENTIALHNFKNGYCGISKIENDEYCLCYLTKAENLKNNQNSIIEMEKAVLFQNPFLKEIFTKSQFLFSAPVTISQISFDKKQPVENHILMVGDAAGMIAPLCGNGMSMAMNSAKIAFGQISLFLNNQLSRQEMEDQYKDNWNELFSQRMRRGRGIQKLFGHEFLTNGFISIVRHFPFLIQKMIKGTHGEEF